MTEKEEEKSSGSETAINIARILAVCLLIVIAATLSRSKTPDSLQFPVTLLYLSASALIMKHLLYPKK